MFPHFIIWRYHVVYISTEDDNSVKEYLRMRNEHKLALKKINEKVLEM